MKKKLNVTDQSIWHSWFAWRPVFTEDNHIVWLERVMRRGKWALAPDITSDPTGYSCPRKVWLWEYCSYEGWPIDDPAAHKGM